MLNPKSNTQKNENRQGPKKKTNQSNNQNQKWLKCLIIAWQDGGMAG